MKRALKYQAGGALALASETRSARSVYMDLKAPRMTREGAEYIIRRAYDLRLLDEKLIEKLLVVAWLGSEDWMSAGEPWTLRARYYVNFGAGLEIDIIRDLRCECPRLSPKVVQQIRGIIRRNAQSVVQLRSQSAAIRHEEPTGFALIERNARARALRIGYANTGARAEHELGRFLEHAPKIVVKNRPPRNS